MGNEKGLAEPGKANAFMSPPTDERPATFKDTLKETRKSVLHPDTSVQLDFDAIDFPAMTLCNMNPVRKSKLDKSEELNKVLKSDKTPSYGKKRKRRKREIDEENQFFRKEKSVQEEKPKNEHELYKADSESQLSTEKLDMKVKNDDDESSLSASQDQNYVHIKQIINTEKEKAQGMDNIGVRPTPTIKSESASNSNQELNDTIDKQRNIDTHSNYLRVDSVHDKVGRFKRDAAFSSSKEELSLSEIGYVFSESPQNIQPTISLMTALPSSFLSLMDSEMSKPIMTASAAINLESSYPMQDFFSWQQSSYDDLFLSADLFNSPSNGIDITSNFVLNSDIIDGNSGGSWSNFGESGINSGNSGSNSGGVWSDSGASGSYSGSYYYSDYDGTYASAYYGYSWNYQDYYLEQLYAAKDEWDERIENFKALIKNESMDLRREMGHQKEDMILSATFAGRVQNVSHFEDFMSVEYGNCYTIESPRYIAWRSGPTHAIKLTLNVEIDEYVDNFATGYGIRIVFHEPGTYPLPSHEGITLSPGTETNIGLRRVQISRLGKPHGDCIDGTEFKQRYNKKYSISACYEFCRILEAINTCDCIPAEAPDEVHLNSTALPVCNTTDNSVEKCLLSVDVIFDSGEVDCHCNGPCQETVYAKTLSSTFWPNDDYLDILVSDICKTKNGTLFWSYVCGNLEYMLTYEMDSYRYNFLRVLIYYEDLNYESITEEPMYESVRFLSDIGGAMGLFLGASVLSFVEFVQLILEVFLFFKHKNERHTPVVDYKKRID